MHVLPLPVIEQQAAVLEPGTQLHAIPAEEVPDDGMAQLPQVPVRIRSKSSGPMPVSRKKADRVS